MFCYQCEQTSKGEGCQTLGVCGKDETTATLQDLLIHVIKGLRCMRIGRTSWARPIRK